MTSLLLVFAAAIVLAYLSQKRLVQIAGPSGHSIDIPLLAMVIMLSFYCGLRTAFNDTATYIDGFQNAVTLHEFVESEPNIWSNPVFYGFQSFFRHHITDNYHIYFLVIAFFTISCFVRFIKRYSSNFTFSILLFICLGLYVSNFAAMKQAIAMAILTLAIQKLLDKKYIFFYLLVFVAILFHTYAIMFVILPLFTRKPWTLITYITIIAVLFILFTFEPTLTSILDYAEELGKEINETEVFETQSINLFRLAVFSVPPLISFLFQSRLKPYLSRIENVMINMSILSFLVMSIGLASAANLFGRSAIYFEIGTIVSLPWLIQKLFEPRSARLVCIIACLFYFVFFLYDVQGWATNYHAIGIGEFISSILS